RHSPLNSSPGAHRQAKTLQNTDKIKLLVCFDLVVGDTSRYADLLLPDNSYLERFTQESIYPSQQYAVTQLGQPTTRAFEGPRPVEVTYLELGKALGLPGVGADAFGPGNHWNTNEDYWLKMAANVAFAGAEPVPDADAEEQSIFSETRQRYLKDAYDERVWKEAVSAEEWPKVVYVLNRGGRFEGHGPDHANGYEGDLLKYRYNGLCQFYDPKVAAAKDPMTGESFDGLAALRDPRLANGDPIPRDGYPLHFINWKARQQGTHRTAGSAWLREVRPSNFVSINPADARPRGIETGDTITIASPSATVTGIALLTEAIRPGIVGADATFGMREYGARAVEIDGETIEPPGEYGHQSSAKLVTPQHEETGYAGPRDAGFAVNDLLIDETLVGGGGMSDPIGGGAAQLDTWVEVTKS
ncbi:MAG: molybdopterin dinucleotide-binding protein, partial [Propionibacterium sp.]|nr:molybdopterin dinucleotide-binding protein [Propionibacterium sp.]